MNVLSLFDGKSSGYTALELAGIPITNYYSSEVDKYAIQVSNAIHPNQTRLGDITKWREWDIDWDLIDLVIAGSPCQGFSFAGKKLAFDDPRSKLFFVFVDILNHVKSLNKNVKFLLENVKMKKEYMDVIDEQLGVESIMINSALVSAQNRQRLYWTNIPADEPIDRGVTWGDVRERGVNQFYYTEKALQWMARHSQRKNKNLDVWGGDEKAQMVEASHYKNYSSQRFFGVCDLPSDKEAVASMRGRRINQETLKREDYNKSIEALQHIEFKYDGKSNCLSTVSKDNIVVPFTLPNRIPLDLFFFRYVTPRECFRLQTVPEHYIDKILACGVSNSQLYKIAGNGWTDEVISHIFQGLKG
jgi:DNA-cytosine methyltransferase